MDMTRRPVTSGELLEVYEQELQTIHEQELLKRLWSRDETLWPGDGLAIGHFRASLEFLQIPEKLPQFVEGILGAETAARAEALTDRVLIAFENAHLLCEALLNIYPLTPPLRCLVLGSSHPSGIRRLDLALRPDPARSRRDQGHTVL